MKANKSVIWFVCIGGLLACSSTSAQTLTPLPHVLSTIVGGGDCNDVNANVSPGNAEVANNLIDDDCDGMADEDINNVPSNDTIDHDQDNFSLAAGDCDDTNSSVHPGATEIVGNFRDDDCDGLADESPSNVPSNDVANRDNDQYTIAPDRIFGSGFDP